MHASILDIEFGEIKEHLFYVNADLLQNVTHFSMQSKLYFGVSWLEMTFTIFPSTQQKVMSDGALVKRQSISWLLVNLVSSW